ncbi:peptidase S8/S53 subtilisin kexin sedolisin [Natrialba taiwanensis DSM 12281]|uniref:Peptidase S8/S53 subtilisin kexin sedolisin n=1 Tax=Natrialba taiwanensis DSM 12281 TaxID=1230458 RepID=M0AB04_9EURY|nr:peptidase S8/S53 subtilisin kexin sedolisin [Natrialba taiwanensis DSM 12281]
MERTNSTGSTADESTDGVATRRRFLTGVGATGFVGGIGLTGSASMLLGDVVGGLVSVGDTLVDDTLNLESSLEQETIVVFETNADADRLLSLDALAGRFDVLPMAYAELTGPLIETVAGWSKVRYISANYELEYQNTMHERIRGPGRSRPEPGSIRLHRIECSHRRHRLGHRRCASGSRGQPASEPAVRRYSRRDRRPAVVAGCRLHRQRQQRSRHPLRGQYRRRRLGQRRRVHRHGSGR